jgi:hypothetical protein
MPSPRSLWLLDLDEASRLEPAYCKKVEALRIAR